MAAVSDVDPSLKSKCLELCQALVDKGTPFTFSLTIGSTFTLSLDTMGKEKSPTPLARKKPSPSTLRRNARRKEQFLKKKAETTQRIIKEKPEAICNWKSDMDNIPQLDGHEEEVTNAVQTVEPAVQTTKSATIPTKNQESRIKPPSPDEIWRNVCSRTK